MVYIQNQDEEQQNQENQQQPTLNTGGPSAPASSSGTSTAQATANAPKPQKFASFQDYVGVNEPQVTQLTDTIANRAKEGFETSKTNLQNTGETLKSNIAQGASTYSSFNPTFVDEAISNPSSITSDPNKLKTWDDYYNATYAGPQNVNETEEYQKAIQEATKSKQRSELFATPEGQKQVIFETAKSPTPGGAALDTALLQANEGAREKLGALSSYGQTFDDLLKGITESSATDIAANKAKAEEARTYTQNTSANEIVNFKKELQDLFDQGVISVQQYNQAVKDLGPTLQQVQSTPNNLVSNPNDVLNSVGNSLWLHPVMRDKAKDALRQYFVNPTTNFNMFEPWMNLKPITSAPTLENFITPAQIGEATALSRLTGEPINVPSVAGTRIDVPTIPTGLNELTSKYLADQKRSQNMRDLSLMFDSSGGPTDYLRGIYNGETPQSIAQKMMGQINARGYTYYPNLSPQKVDAIRRIANGSLSADLYR